MLIPVIYDTNNMVFEEEKPDRPSTRMAEKGSFGSQGSIEANTGQKRPAT